MSTVGQRERETQKRVVSLFRKTLKYDYLGEWEEREGNRNVEEDLLRALLLDMDTRSHLRSGRGNALLVSDSINQACKFYELFLARGFDRCSIVTSYQPTGADILDEETGEEQTEKRWTRSRRCAPR